MHAFDDSNHLAEAMEETADLHRFCLLLCPRQARQAHGGVHRHRLLLLPKLPPPRTDGEHCFWCVRDPGKDVAAALASSVLLLMAELRAQYCYAIPSLEALLLVSFRRRPCSCLAKAERQARLVVQWVAHVYLYDRRDCEKSGGDCQPTIWHINKYSSSQGNCFCVSLCLLL